MIAARPIGALLVALASAPSLAAEPALRDVEGLVEVPVVEATAVAPATASSEAVAVAAPVEPEDAAEVLEGGEDEVFGADDYDPLRDSPAAIKAAGWRRSGVVFVVVGAVLGIGGLIMSQTDACSLDAGNGCQESARLRGSLAMGVPGALLVGSGAAMLAVGAVRSRRLRAGLEASRGRLGVGVVWRF